MTQTEVTRLLHPYPLPGTAWVSDARLAAAVSTPGLGIISAMNPAAITFANRFSNAGR